MALLFVLACTVPFIALVVVFHRKATPRLDAMNAESSGGESAGEVPEGP